MQTLLFSNETEEPKAVNVASVPQRSPFRYPGGKTWFVPRLREWLRAQHKKPQLFIEPFAGGGIISLTAVFEDLVDEALLVEKDDEVADVWEAILGGEAEGLAQRIMEFEMNKDNVVNTLCKTNTSIEERAFQTILKNRTNHGGILATGSGLIKNGEKGKGLLSRWYPKTLATRIRYIDRMKHKLQFKHADGMDIIRQHADDSEVVFFIDPPYTAGGKKAGKRLYTHYALDHAGLFEICSKVAGDLIMTYDNADEVIELAKHFGFQAKPISMKNTHHAAMTELVIGRNLDWMASARRVLEDGEKYKT